MYSKKQRIMAWLGIAFLLLLYLVSFLLGIFGSKKAFPMYMASLLATFFIPAMIYIYQLLMKNAKERREKAARQEESEEE